MIATLNFSVRCGDLCEIVASRANYEDRGPTIKEDLRGREAGPAARVKGIQEEKR